MARFGRYRAALGARKTKGPAVVSDRNIYGWNFWRIAACIVFFGRGGLFSLARYGSFYKAIGGNLWGMLVIFWAMFDALVSAGVALLFYAWRGPPGRAGMPTHGPWSSPPRLPLQSN
jgi:hypothetical protein